MHRSPGGPPPDGPPAPPGPPDADDVYNFLSRFTAGIQRGLDESRDADDDERPG
ncbi:MAG: hypothetical protein ACLFXM_14185 [Acidimicrobiia bacterium]